MQNLLSSEIQSNTEAKQQQQPQKPQLYKSQILSPQTIITQPDVQTTLNVLDGIIRFKTKLQCNQTDFFKIFKYCQVICSQVKGKKKKKLFKQLGLKSDKKIKIKQEKCDLLKKKLSERQQIITQIKIQQRELQCIQQQKMLRSSESSSDQNELQLKSAKQLVFTNQYKNIPNISCNQKPRIILVKKCYICKQKMSKYHSFYFSMCEACGEFNFQKREMHCDLTGKVALVTGGRTKIGFEIVLKLLRDNAQEVIVTTRFPKTAAEKYKNQKDYQNWKSRLIIYGLDLKDRNSLMQFCGFIQSKYKRVDILINNAAQTIRKTPAAYIHMIKKEIQESEQDFKQIIGDDFERQGYNNSSTQQHNQILSQNSQTSLITPQQFNKIPHYSKLALLAFQQQDLSNSGFNHKMTDIHDQKVDLRSTNTWTSKLSEVNVGEFVQVLMVNVIAPFILNQQLKPIMKKQNSQHPSFIINVSAMQGVFSIPRKSYRHPHTNMAKAALNMMTKTCGRDFVQDNIYMTSVDTGWVTNQFPLSFNSGLIQPLDQIDGAMRVLDPVYSGLNIALNNGERGELLHSVFLKDYKIHQW